MSACSMGWGCGTLITRNLYMPDKGITDLAGVICPLSTLSSLLGGGTSIPIVLGSLVGEGAGDKLLTPIPGLRLALRPGGEQL